MSYTPGPRQKLILRAATGDRWFVARTLADQLSCLKLHDNGFLDRDPKDSRRYRASAAGEAWLKQFDENFGRKRA